MEFEALKSKAASLPLVPGVYIMRDKQDKVIYIGKAKKLKNRVCQYFQDTASHTPKTRQMVSKIHHFDVIVADSEFEALVLECSLIKQYLPKYNILLKDGKGYPYLRLDMSEEYPRITVVSKIENDGASYYGPFGSRGVTQNLLQTILHTLKLPTCSKQFPRDIGKGRPCLNLHMNQCSGWCLAGKTVSEYRDTVEQARQLLLGNYKQVAARMKEQMIQAAEELNFELAASLRDRLTAIESLSQKQLVTAGALADIDAIGYAQNESKACFTVLHFSKGNLLDKDFEIFGLPDDPAAAVSSLLKQYYLARGFAPNYVYLPFAIDDSDIFSKLLEETHGKKAKLRVPKKGDNLRMVELACKNALEEVERITEKEEKRHSTLNLLSKMLSIPSLNRIEAYDISNISGSDIVAGMVVFENGVPRKRDYKHFKIKDMSNQDDYGSMHQVLNRRFTHYLNQDRGFDILPDLLLIDGGLGHAQIAVQAIAELGLDIPVVGMVKDDRHRTRALITPDGREIQIDVNPSIYSFIGIIQEETHRFAISYHRKLRSNRLRYSELDKIPGIGPKRKEVLLKTFRSLTAIRNATVQELEQILPKDAAASVYNYFHDDRGE